jgi:hypothetical protein
MAKPAHRNRTRRLENSATDVSERQPRLGVRWLHLWHRHEALLYSSRLLMAREAAGYGAQQAEGEPPNEKRVHSSRQNRFLNLESVPSFHFHHTAEGKNERPQWSVGRRVSSSVFPCQGVEVFLKEFGGPLGRTVVVCGC